MTTETTQTTDTPTILTIGTQRYRLPFADLLPPLTAEEYALLKEDIQVHGIRVPIVVTETRDAAGPLLDVIDGQHRLKIAGELGLEADAIPQRTLTGAPDDLADAAWALNVHRRQLTKAQRDEAAVKLRQAGMSYRQIAARLDASPETVRRAVKAAGPDVQPETVQGADGKSYDAVQPETRYQQLGCKLLDRFDDEHPRWTIDELRDGLSEAERGDIHPALNLLVADGQLAQVGRGVYIRVPDRDWESLILQVLANGPQTLAWIALKLKRMVDDAYIPTRAIQAALGALRDSGRIELSGSQYQIVETDEAPADPDDAQPTAAPAPSGPDYTPHILAALEDGPLTFAELISAIQLQQRGQTRWVANEVLTRNLRDLRSSGQVDLRASQYHLLAAVSASADATGMDPDQARAVKSRDDQAIASAEARSAAHALSYRDWQTVMAGIADYRAAVAGVTRIRGVSAWREVLGHEKVDDALREIELARKDAQRLIAHLDEMRDKLRQQLVTDSQSGV